jgi:hypothetical protein
MENEQNQIVEQKSFFSSKTNGVLLLALIVLVVIALVWMWQDKEKYFGVGESVTEEVVIDQQEVKDTYTYTNHGFSIELPKGFVPKEELQHSGPALMISLPIQAHLAYITDSHIDFWQVNLKQYTYVEDKKIGETVFSVYTYSGSTIYWYQQGKVAYEFGIGTDKKNELESLLKTFKFVGWSQIEGDNKKVLLTNGHAITVPMNWVVENPKPDEECTSIHCETSDARAGNWATKLKNPEGSQQDTIFIGPNDAVDSNCNAEYESYCASVEEGVLVWTFSTNDLVVDLAKSIVQKWK